MVNRSNGSQLQEGYADRLPRTIQSPSALDPSFRGSSLGTHCLQGSSLASVEAGASWQCVPGQEPWNKEGVLRQFTFANPVGVEFFAARFVGAFVGMSTEVVALSLQQVGWQTTAAVTVVIGQS